MVSTGEVDEHEDREVSAGFDDFKKQFGEKQGASSGQGGPRSEGVRLFLAEGTAWARVLRWRIATL